MLYQSNLHHTILSKCYILTRRIKNAKSLFFGDIYLFEQKRLHEVSDAEGFESKVIKILLNSDDR